MRGIINIDEQLKEDRTAFRQFLDVAARVVTSIAFFSFCALFIFVWIGAQIYLYKKHHHEEISFLDKPPTFFLLGFIFTLTSFLLTVLILSSQRRQAESDRVRDLIEYQVNLKAQAEIMRLKIKMDKVIHLLNKISRNDSIEEEEETIL